MLKRRELDQDGLKMSLALVVSILLTLTISKGLWSAQIVYSNNCDSFVNHSKGRILADGWQMAEWGPGELANATFKENVDQARSGSCQEIFLYPTTSLTYATVTLYKILNLTPGYLHTIKVWTLSNAQGTGKNLTCGLGWYDWDGVGIDHMSAPSMGHEWQTVNSPNVWTLITMQKTPNTHPDSPGIFLLASCLGLPALGISGYFDDIEVVKEGDPYVTPTPTPLPIKNLEVHYTLPIGLINLTLGANKIPYTDSGNNISVRVRDVGIKRLRTHDIGIRSPYPTDWYSIFPNWNADPELPGSYNFVNTLSDARIANIKDNGFDVLYRLGISWDAGDHPNNDWKQPPPDPYKWANTCKHIVMHYNNGWANGFRYNIKYWEVWNEPDLDIFWTGTAQQFYQLYSATAQTLKAYDPTLKVGACGVAHHWDNNYVHSFIAYCREHNIPLDFYSWHLYPNGYGATNYYVAANYIRAVLDANGFTETESICDEWNIWCGINYDYQGTVRAAAHTAAALIYFADRKVASVYYYPLIQYWGLFDVNGNYRKETYSYKAFHLLQRDTPIRLNTVGLVGDAYPPYAVMAGKSLDGRLVQVLISQEESVYLGFRLTLNGLPANSQAQVTYYLINETNDLSPVAGGTFTTTENRRYIELERNLANNEVCLVRVELTGNLPLTNLLANGSYEQGLTYWEIFNPQSTLSCTLNNAVTYDGEKSLLISCNNPNQSGYIAHLSEGLTENNEYLGIIYAKASANAVGGYFNLGILCGERCEKVSPQYLNDTEWRSYQITYKYGPQPQNNNALIIQPKYQGDVYFDFGQLYLLAVASPTPTATFTSTPSPTPTSKPCLKGDADCNYSLTPADALLTFKIYLHLYAPSGNEPCTVECAGDWNRDGNITPLDSLCIFKAYLEIPC